MLKISIPKPCQESWQQMQPTQRGAFCNVCSKEVVDFTQMTDDEVKNYFLQGNNRSTCGRFRADQLSNISIEIPLAILQKRMAGWKKFLAIIMISFGTMLFGCEVKTGKALAQHTKAETAVDSTNLYESAFAGGITIVDDDFEEDTISFSKTTCRFVKPAIIGDTIVMPEGLIESSTDSIKVDQKILPPEKVDTPKVKQKIPADSTTCGDDIIYSK